MPLAGEGSAFSIFMASSTTRVSPSFTLSPTALTYFTIMPGMGAVMGVPLTSPAGAALGASAFGASAAGAGAAGAGAATAAGGGAYVTTGGPPRPSTPTSKYSPSTKTLNLRRLPLGAGACFCGFSTSCPALALRTRSSSLRTSSIVRALTSGGGTSLPYFHLRNFRPVTG